MFRICFQNGPDAPEHILGEEFETREEAKKRLDWFASHYGTVEDAAAWIEGDEKPAKLKKAEAAAAKAEAELSSASEPA